MKDFKISDVMEKVLSGIFGVVGILAILVNLFIKGLSGENILDAAAGIAGLVVTITVFLVTVKIFRKMKFEDFVSRFEAHLQDWADQNKYLIDIESVGEERGKEKKRSYFMLIDHSNLVTAEEEASQTNKKKGAFLYLPLKGKMEKLQERIEFRLNESTFKRQNKFKDVKEIVQKFAERINYEFHDSLKIEAFQSKQDANKIEVSLENVPKTEKSAKLLVDMVEFVKTMVLALA